MLGGLLERPLAEKVYWAVHGSIPGSGGVWLQELKLVSKSY